MLPELKQKSELKAASEAPHGQIDHFRNSDFSSRQLIESQTDIIATAGVVLSNSILQKDFQCEVWWVESKPKIQQKSLTGGAA